MPSEIIFLVTGGSGDNETAPRGASSMGIRYGANKKTTSETRAVWFRGNLACLGGADGRWGRKGALRLRSTTQVTARLLCECEAGRAARQS